VKAFSIPTIAYSAAEERRLLEITIQAPSSFQHPSTWRFVIAARSGRCGQESAATTATNQAQIHRRFAAGACFTADLKAWSKQPERYWAKCPPSGG